MSVKELRQEIQELAKEHNLELGLDIFKDYYNVRQENIATIGEIFLEIFMDVPVDFLIKLTKASNFYYYSLLAIDHIIDEDKIINNSESLLFTFSLREKSLRIMYELFAPNHIFWKYFDKYYIEYTTSGSYENRNSVSDNQNKLSEEAFEKIYMGKSALLKATLTAMALKSNNSQTIEPLEKSVDYYQIALGLFDDVNDWKKDFKNNQYNYLLKLAFKNSDPQKLLNSDTKTIGKHIFFSGAATRVLQLAVEYHQKAILFAKHINCRKWMELVLSEKKKCENLLEDINIIVNKELIRTGSISVEKKDLPVVRAQFDHINSQFKKPFEIAINHIINQWYQGFVDTKVFNFFAEQKGFSFKQRFYSGDVFHRAVILDLLCDINPILQGSLSPFLIYEAEYLKSKVHENGWWNYYLDLEYQPCDIDTTSQVMQSLIKMDMTEFITSNTIQSLDLFLEWQKVKRGGIGTWFLPPVSQSSEEQLTQRKFYEDYINLDVDSTNDIEVMANLLYTLSKYNQSKYKDIIQKSSEYLERQQLDNGSWNESWYWGCIYGVYACVRILYIVKPKSTALKKAMDFIINTQNNDGGWGWEKGNSDPLNSAFALITLHNSGEEYKSLIEKGILYLQDSLSDKEQLKRSRYINFQKQKYSAFKSDSITMAYALKAFSLFL